MKRILAVLLVLCFFAFPPWGLWGNLDKFNGFMGKGGY